MYIKSRSCAPWTVNQWTLKGKIRLNQTRIFRDEKDFTKERTENVLRVARLREMISWSGIYFAEEIGIYGFLFREEKEIFSGI